MKVRKNIEGVFLVAAVISTFAAYATADERVSRAPATVQAIAPAAGEMQVVVVKAKRLTPAEKLALK